MSASVSLVRSYRSALREINKSAIQPRGRRNQAVLGMLRSVYEEKRSAGSGEDKQFTRDLNELTQFVKAGRLHTELLIRYNPLQGLSTEDRVTATAKRVGLSSPTGYVKGQEFGRGWAVKDESGSEGGNEEGGR
ncbi:hypothetical protein FFLO_05781 [Filobasidium floriforme]|uniref:Uncharacterized protein n=1 Tax=Filobasidium floriforme TaxID=5210 RepID=A0A8K0JG56_9TREE|nr:uncharacterized protein HD553DRAFT_340466 [Filobasidium floriforme]KAG7529140.1 hypothetical protein FFLO_05781 [Filobasidium floriforme]KAH8087303.1 hypothetical protein HD553DRAFT_340466 [Filobasidium floriforme]